MERVSAASGVEAPTRGPGGKAADRFSPEVDSNLLQEPSRIPWRLVIFLSLLHGSTSMANMMLSPITPFIEDAFHSTKAELGILFSAASLGGGVSSMPGGWLGDRVPRLWIFLGSTLLTAVLMALAGFTSDYWILAAVLTLAGAAAGLVFPTINKTMAESVPVRGRATAMGVKQAGMPLFNAVGAVAFPFLAVAMAWQVSLIVAGAVIAAIGLLSLLFRNEFRGGGFRAPSRGHAGGRVITPRLVALAAMAFAVNGASSALAAYLLVFLRDEFQIPPTVGGFYLGLAGLAGVVSRFAVGVTSDYLFAARRFVVMRWLAGFGCLAAALMAVLPATTHPLLLGLLVTVFFAAIYGWTSVFHSAVVETAGAANAAEASGFTTGVGYVGMLCIPPLFGWLIDATGSYALSWSSLAVVMLVVLGLVLAMRDAPRFPHPDPLP